jgi:hypothetical protein
MAALEIIKAEVQHIEEQYGMARERFKVSFNYDPGYALRWYSAEVAHYQKLIMELLWIKNADELTVNELEDALENVVESAVHATPNSSACGWTRAFEDVGFGVRKEAIKKYNSFIRLLKKEVHND